MTTSAGEPGWVVALGDTIVLDYKLSSQTGVDFESTFDGEPIALTLGQGELAATLEQCLLGLTLGERHVFLLQAEQAFGRSDAGLVQRVPLEAFPPEIAVRENAMIEFTLPNGNTLPGVVREIGQADAVVDFNHPLSDCPVLFEVEVREIRRPADRPPHSH
jgi:FKBP-type peptidyl-prolyl cis-trans isomerase SlpA